MKITIAPGGGVTKVVSTLRAAEANDRHAADVVKCAENALALASFPATRKGGTFVEKLLVDPTCTTRLANEADDALERGHRESGLSELQSVIEVCRPEPAHVSKAFLLACELHRVSDAKLLFARLSADEQASLAKQCSFQVP